MRYSAMLAITLVAGVVSVSGAQITIDEDQNRAPESISRLDSARIDHQRRSSSYQQLMQQATALLRKETDAASPSEQIEWTLRAVKLTNRLTARPASPSHWALRELHGRLRARLRSIHRQTLANQQRQARHPHRIEVRLDILAQLNQAVNGPVRPGGANAANNLVPQDYGPLLVQLIQRTISPESWDVNGGLSTIRYWRPGMALVVRAPQRLHADVGPILGQLRSQ